MEVNTHIENIQTELISELKNPENTGKKFRFKNQKVMLTYKTWINKEEFRKWVCYHFCEPKTIYIAHECGKNDPITPYEHSHVVMDLGRAFDRTDVRLFDFNGIHPNISIIDKIINWKRACKYICKEDKSVTLNDVDRFNATTSVWENRSLTEALERCRLQDVNNTIALFKNRPIELPEPEIEEDEFFSWQKTMWEIICKKPDNRSVMWLFDKKGNSGKTVFAKWCCLKHPDKCIMMNNVGRISDFSMNLQNFQEKGWRGDVCFLNLSRSYSDRTNIYEACEIIKDGYITCTKYQGGCTWLPAMHVIVMSNFLPQTDKLSEDRWRFFTINEERELIRVTLKYIGELAENAEGDGDKPIY